MCAPNSATSLLVLDGGACAVGIESTIVDCTRGAPVLLRPGVLTRAQVEAACGQPLRSPQELQDAGAPRAPARWSRITRPAPGCA